MARLEWGGLLVTCAVLTFLRWNEVDWITFVVLFVVIDAIGYLPGAVAFRRSRTGDISRVYYGLYNTMHCLTTWTLILGVWVVWSGWQWAFLAVPLHLLGDRALFGNSLKPFGVSFEPKTHPVFGEFRVRYGAAETRRRRRADADADVRVESASG